MHSISYGSDASDARTVVLLHGGGVAGWMWEPSLIDENAGNRIIVVDLPGHGQSDDDRYESHTVTVDRLASLLRRDSRDAPATVVGFSLGAQLAILLASRHPDLVDGIVAVSAQAKSAPFSGIALGLLGLAAPLARRRWFAKLQARELFIPSALRENYIATSASITRETLLASVGENMRFRIPDGWSDFRGRSLVMVGEREHAFMRESAASIAAGNSRSELLIVAGCGHGVPLQRPDWFRERVGDWIAAG
ncbi:alpha/beta fold hydrolase [Microbacterium sp. GXF0217]